MDDLRPEALLIEPIRGRIDAGLAQLELPAWGARQVDQLARLTLLLAQWSPRMNLTGHRDPLEMVSRLILDAAGIVSSLPELAAAGRLADLGSGAGFPGLPVAILQPRLEVYLVEARQKRHHFQREARRQLGLENAFPILGRSEVVEPIACDVAIAQAMAQPAEALERLARWTRPGGLMVVPASAGSRPPPLPSDSRLEVRSYRVPFADVQRLLWVVRRPHSDRSGAQDEPATVRNPAAL